MNNGIKLFAITHAEIIAEEGKLLFTEPFVKERPGMGVYLRQDRKAIEYADGLLVTGDNGFLYETLVHVF